MMRAELDEEALFLAQSPTTSGISWHKPHAGNIFILDDKKKLDEKHIMPDTQAKQRNRALRE